MLILPPKIHQIYQHILQHIPTHEHHRITIFGSCTTNKPVPEDIDLCYNAQDLDIDWYLKDPIAHMLLRAGRGKNYGYLDSFAQTHHGLMVRNGESTGFIPAKNKRSILQAINTGISVESFNQLRHIFP